MSSEEIFGKLTQVVIDGEIEIAPELARQALDLGLDPLAIINEGLTPGIKHIGQAFGRGDLFIPDLVMGADAMQAAIAILEPELAKRKQERQVVAKVVLGTVRGDIHEIGKTLVGTMLTANGFQVIDIGADKPAAEFVAVVKETQAALVGASALMTTTMLEQERIIEALEEAGLREQVKVMVGGAPVSRSWAEEIGADGYAEDAMSAVDLAFRLIDLPA